MKDYRCFKVIERFVEEKFEKKVGDLQFVVSCFTWTLCSVYIVDDNPHVSGKSLHYTLYNLKSWIRDISDIICKIYVREYICMQNICMSIFVKP